MASVDVEIEIGSPDILTSNLGGMANIEHYLRIQRMLPETPTHESKEISNGFTMIYQTIHTVIDRAHDRLSPREHIVGKEFLQKDISEVTQALSDHNHPVDAIEAIMKVAVKLEKQYHQM